MLKIRKELKKSIVNIWFILPCILLCLLSGIQNYLKISEYNEIMGEILKSDLSVNPCLHIYTSFTMWIGNDTSTVFSTIFFSISPLIAAIPYSWSLCKIIKSGELTSNNISSQYYFNKFVSVFISSGLLIAIPLSMNFIVTSLFVPSVTPDSVYDIYYGIFSNDFGGQLFYTLPYVYILSFILLNFVFYGLFGCIGLYVSIFFKRKIVSIITPAIIIYSIELLKKRFFTNLSIEISPISFLCPIKAVSCNHILIITEIAIMLLVTLVFPITRGGSDET